ncbi:MAG: cation-translocating P-type ATPase [Firmicutes bacterium]|nr:cation-translocating P-type ATPase [Bacillota bacterium]MCL1953679.1 cation-translocating P-type ATPase [Bacillota bacterium]
MLEENKNYYNLEASSVLESFSVNQNIGLSPKQIEENTSKWGANQFAKKKKDSIIKIILHPLMDISAIILIIAAILSFGKAIVTPKANISDYISPFVIIAIIVINVVLSVVQTKGSEKALDALSQLNSPHCFVIRDGHKTKLYTSQVVPGDIVVLKTGDLVPADARIVSCTEFLVDEASLTGESEPVKKISDALQQKDASLGDQKNMVFSGCLVVGGNATVVVLSTGMNTQIGKIANYLSTTKKRKTPLQLRLNKMARVVCGIAIVAALMMLILGLAQQQDGWDLSLVVITLAVAAVPETLSVIVTLILTYGIKSMVQKNALIRKLQAVETLGSTSVICSDKTGTLTQNMMSVTRIWHVQYDPINEESELNTHQLDMLHKYMLASNATIETDDNGKEIIIGDPTESALMRLAINKGIDINLLKQQYPRVAEIPFSSARKMMTVVVKNPDGGYLVLTKGAFDRLPYDKSDLYLEQTRQTMHDSFAHDALRVITLASKEIVELPEKWQLSILEQDLNFVGFVGIIDPPRPQAKIAIELARNAGIRTIMITGDHATTATAIARNLGIIAHQEGVLTGQQLNKMTDEELYNSIEYYSVYARVSPEDKIRIVQAWQKIGAVVSMTGDGVNDAPALKAADVGIAMGIAGTEVAKSAADMVLVDDKFSTIVEAVSEGRNVFSNIRKTIYFLVVCNLSEIFMMIFGVLIFKQDTSKGIIWWLPVTPLMLLVVNVLCDGIPGMALAKERSDQRIMKRKPFNRNESFFGGGLMQAIIQQSIAFTIAVLVAYYIGTNGSPNDLNHEIGQTMAFLVLGWTSILHVLTVRSRKSFITTKYRNNPQLVYSVVGTIIIFSSLVFIPSINTTLKLTPNIGLQNWVATIGLAIFPIIVAEYSKFWDNYRYKNDEKNRVEQRRI